MKKILGILIMMLLITTTIQVLASTEETKINTQMKDQYQEQWQGAEYIESGSGWQEFKPGMAKFAKLELKIALVTAYWMGNLKVELLEGSTSGNVLEDWYITIGSVPSSPSWVVFTASQPRYTVPGQTYVIKVTVPLYSEIIWYFADGNLYPDGLSSIGACCDFTFRTYAYLNMKPTDPTISGSSSGQYGTPYKYTFVSTDLDGDDVCYYIKWGDGDEETWTSYQPSGNSLILEHTYMAPGTYPIEAKAKDAFGAECNNWGTITVTMPKNKSINALFMRPLEDYPILYKMLQRFFKL